MNPVQFTNTYYVYILSLSILLFAVSFINILLYPRVYLSNKYSVVKILLQIFVLFLIAIFIRLMSHDSFILIIKDRSAMESAIVIWTLFAGSIFITLVLSLIRIILKDFKTEKDLKIKELDSLNDKLKSNEKTLEDKLIEKTQELSSKIKDLENINKLMMGRELRMADLKDENKKLKEIVDQK